MVDRPRVPVRLRAARLSELPALAKMRIALQEHLKASNPHVWMLDRHSLPAIEANYRDMLTKGGDRICFLVAEAAGSTQPRAMAIGRVAERPEFTPAVTGLIDDVWVDPELRGGGIAKALLADLAAFFRRHNAETIVLDYVIGNREAERLWGSLGFTPVQVGADARLGDFERKLRGDPHR
ncbi:MAG TPA: GNAT family N-acetyltransferase [Hyphomicrobiaceae bacterium]|nr:GNAT family N-acetyltransferase [Hyphomicrobiaceae bacterium]